MRIWPEGSGKDPEPLGHIDHMLHFRPNSRRVEHAELTFTSVAGANTVVTIEPITASYLALGTGYGVEKDWRHGMYQGPLVTQHRTFDLSDPVVVKQTSGLVDNLARFEVDGHIGYGLFENAVLGPNERYGF